MGNVTTKLIEAYAEVNLNEKKKLDPVDAKALNKDDAADRKDGDIDNDGDVDKSDEYLHNRRKAVKKAMKDEAFEPHMMYDPKTGKGYKADKEEDHLRMKKMGYTHEKPVEEAYEGTMVCEDCGCEQENPDPNCNCKNDSQDLQASYWTPKESYLAAQKKNEEVEGTTMKESQKAELAKRLAKASASSAKGRKLVSLKKAPWEKEKKEGNEEEVIMNPSKDKKNKKDNKGEVDGGMAESSDVNELSNKTLASYAKRAVSQNNTNYQQKQADKMKKGAIGKAKKGDMKDMKKMWSHELKKKNRKTGAALATDKLSKNLSASYEEFELPTVYSRILEARKNPEGEKAGSTASKGEADFVKSHTANVQVDDTEAKGHDDVSKAGRAGPSTKARPSDNMKGDKKIMPSATPMKGK